MADNRFKLVFRSLRGNLRGRCIVDMEDGESPSEPSCLLLVAEDLRDRGLLGWRDPAG